MNIEELRTARERGERPVAAHAYLSDAYLSGADLSDADLRGANLSGADLSDADLRGANLSDADLSDAYLSGAYLSHAYLSDAYLSHAYLSDADLRGANLSGANLRGANLRGANLRGANLRGANLWGAGVGILTIPCGIPSGSIALTPTPDGWTLRVGCWTGTVDTLRTLIASDTGWPAATGDEVAHRRPILTAVCDLADAHIAYHADIVPALAEKWGAK